MEAIILQKPEIQKLQIAKFQETIPKPKHPSHRRRKPVTPATIKCKHGKRRIVLDSITTGVNMNDYLGIEAISSGMVSTMHKGTELDLQAYLQNSSSTRAQTTGTNIHDFFEWLAKEGLHKGLDADDFLRKYATPPADGKLNSIAGINKLCNYYESINRSKSPIKPSKMAGWKSYLEKLIQDCPFPQMSHGDTEAIKGVWQELQRREKKSKTLRLIKYALSESVWQYEGLKMRPDLYLPDFILSIKTTNNIAHFEREIYKYKYNISESHYRHMAQEVTGKEHYTIFLVVENKAPYRIRLIQPKKTTLDSWYNDYLTALEKTQETLKRIKRNNLLNGFESFAENNLGIEVL